MKKFAKSRKNSVKLKVCQHTFWRRRRLMESTQRDLDFSIIIKVRSNTEIRESSTRRRRMVLTRRVSSRHINLQFKTRIL